jgi:iron complex outermembrane recepter protein
VISRHVLRRDVFAVAMILCLSIAHAADNNADSGASPDISEVVVTGTRIRQPIDQGTTSVTVITGQQLESQGYRNVFDALNNLPQNTGFTQGADFGNTFTPAANAISLRGLGPNHTLVLFNGRRVADYPIAYDGSVNFVDLATVSSAAIDRIEILNGGASAIYGSDAIAGVVNVILKDHADGVDINAKIGTTERGGGNNARFQAFGGDTFGKLSGVFALEIGKTNPIWSCTARIQPRSGHGRTWIRVTISRIRMTALHSPATSGAPSRPLPDPRARCVPQAKPVLISGPYRPAIKVKTCTAS